MQPATSATMKPVTDIGETAKPGNPRHSFFTTAAPGSHPHLHSPRETLGYKHLPQRLALDVRRFSCMSKRRFMRPQTTWFILLYNQASQGRESKCYANIKHQTSKLDFSLLRLSPVPVPWLWPLPIWWGRFPLATSRSTFFKNPATIHLYTCTLGCNHCNLVMRRTGLFRSYINQAKQNVSDSRHVLTDCTVLGLGCSFGLCKVSYQTPSNTPLFRSRRVRCQSVKAPPLTWASLPPARTL